MKVYLLNHQEIMDFGNGPQINDLVLHVASSEYKAVEWMQKTRINPWSWWELIEHTLDAKPEDDYFTIGFYGGRGGKLKKQPYDKAVAAYEKAKAAGLM